jgi:hypothetical protein
MATGDREGRMARFADRLEERTRIFGRIKASIDPSDPGPTELVSLRGSLQVARQTLDDLAELGLLDDPEWTQQAAALKDVLAVEGTRFEAIMGRPFDPARDRVDWPEVNALPYPSLCN